MSLSYPPLLLLGLLVAAALIVGAVLAARRRAAALAAAGVSVAGGRRDSQLGLYLSLGGLVLLAVAVAGPAASLPVGRSAGTVIVAMDVSNSMSADDVTPSRLAAAQQAALSFIDAQPDSVDIGVVGFDQGALTTSQPSADRAASKAAVQNMRTAGGTSLASAILGSLSAITGSPVRIGEDGDLPDIGHWSSATIVLFSDGEDQGGTSGSDAVTAAATIAQNAGVHIEAVGVGTADGATVEIDGYQLHTALDTWAADRHRAGHRRPLPPRLRRGAARRCRLHHRPPADGCEAGRATGRRVHRRGAGAAGRWRAADRCSDGEARLMSFSWPWALLSLLIIPIVAGVVWLLRRRRRRAAVRVTSIALVRAALPPRTRWTRLIPALLLLLGFATLGVGAARPQATVPVPSNSTTIILAMDVSGSMCSTDVEPNRLTVAQKAAVSFIESQDGETKIGLVAFAGVAGLQVPPTTDKDALIEAIDNFTTARGTAIGSAILTSIDSIAAINPTVAPTGVDAESAQRSGYAADVIVVLTDGANTQGVGPAAAAESAAVRGLRVFTIGFGTTTPSRMACTGRQAGGWAGGGPAGGFGGGGFGGGGGRSPRVIDEATLQAVAEITGGQYYKAESADQLQEALGDLPSQVTVVKKHVDIASWFAGAGGLLVAVAVGLSLWWNRVRAPR